MLTAGNGKTRMDRGDWVLPKRKEEKKEYC